MKSDFGAVENRNRIRKSNNFRNQKMCCIALLQYKGATQQTMIRITSPGTKKIKNKNDHANKKNFLLRKQIACPADIHIWLCVV
jgi:hypothetical protein